MTRGRVALSWATAAVAVWACVCVWVIDRAGSRPGSEYEWSLAERVLLSAAHLTVRDLPFVVLPLALALLGFLVSCVVRLPRVSTPEEWRVAVASLGRNVKECWVLVFVMFALSPLWFLRTRAVLVTVGLLSVPLLTVFPVAYAASMYRALQVQSYRRDHGEVRLWPRGLGAVGIVTFMAGVAPLGLIAFSAVARGARRDIQNQDSAASRPTRA